MSSYARAVLIAKNRLDHVADAARPKRRFFGGFKDEFESVLGAESRGRVDFEQSGYVLASLLTFLADAGVDLFRSELSPWAEQIAATRQCACLIFSDDLRSACSARLAQLQLDEVALGRYHAELTDTQDQGAGEAMVEGLGFLRTVLDAVSADTLAIVVIG